MKFSVNNFDKHEDSRGIFYEIPNIMNHQIFQSSISISKKDVLRGLHYQHSPEMGKQINILSGAILECIVDIRPQSDSFGKHKKMFCDPKRNSSIYIPPGFAHGFLTLENNTTIMYHQTAKYNKLGEGTISPFDTTLQINWGIEKGQCIMSERDMKSESFLQYKEKEIMWSVK